MPPPSGKLEGKKPPPGGFRSLEPAVHHFEHLPQMIDVEFLPVGLRRLEVWRTQLATATERMATTRWWQTTILLGGMGIVAAMVIAVIDRIVASTPCNASCLIQLHP